MWHLEVPSLGAKVELLLLPYSTATATQDVSHTCHSYHSSGQHQILNPLRNSKNRICILTDNSQVDFCSGTMGTPPRILNCILRWEKMNPSNICFKNICFKNNFYLSYEMFHLFFCSFHCSICFYMLFIIDFQSSYLLLPEYSLVTHLSHGLHFTNHKTFSQNTCLVD